MIDVQRHPQGPRVFILGRRVHEYMLGGVVLAAVAAGWLSGLVHDSLVPVLLAALGLWLVAKDWRDIFPSRRDSASWRLGVHRRAAPLRKARHSEGIASLAALLALAVAGVNLVSALTPNVHRAHACSSRSSPCRRSRSSTPSRCRLPPLSRSWRSRSGAVGAGPSTLRCSC